MAGLPRPSIFAPNLAPILIPWPTRRSSSPIYVALAVVAVLPATIAILVVARDIMIIGAFMISLIMRKPVKVKPLMISKFNTAAQISFAAMVLGVKAFDFPAGAWLDVSLYAVAI